MPRRPDGSIVCRWEPSSGPYEPQALFCTRCGVLRPRDWFGDNPRNRSGKASHCAPCNRQYYRSRRGGPFRPKREYNCRTCGKRCFGYASDQCQTCRVRERRQLAAGVLPLHVARPCKRCGKPFTPEQRNQQRYCSVECRYDGRDHGRPGKLCKSKRQAILNRDGWKCYLCGRQIPQDARWPDPLSGTVDHVVPYSVSKNFHPDNLRAAHWSCNYDKGDQLPGTEIWIPAEAA